MLKYVIVRATLRFPISRSFSLQVLSSFNPNIKWTEDFDGAHLFNDEKDAILLSKDVSKENWPASVIAIYFESTEE